MVSESSTAPDMPERECHSERSSPRRPATACPSRSDRDAVPIRRKRRRSSSPRSRDKVRCPSPLTSHGGPWGCDGNQAPSTSNHTRRTYLHRGHDGACPSANGDTPGHRTANRTSRRRSRRSGAHACPSHCDGSRDHTFSNCSVGTANHPHHLPTRQTPATKRTPRQKLIFSFSCFHSPRLVHTFPPRRRKKEWRAFTSMFYQRHRQTPYRKQRIEDTPRGYHIAHLTYSAFCGEIGDFLIKPNTQVAYVPGSFRDSQTPQFAGAGRPGYV